MLKNMTHFRVMFSQFDWIHRITAVQSAIIETTEIIIITILAP